MKVTSRLLLTLCVVSAAVGTNANAGLIARVLQQAKVVWANPFGKVSVAGGTGFTYLAYVNNRLGKELEDSKKRLAKIEGSNYVNMDQMVKRLEIEREYQDSRHDDHSNQIEALKHITKGVVVNHKAMQRTLLEHVHAYMKSRYQHYKGVVYRLPDEARFDQTFESQVKEAFKQRYRERAEFKKAREEGSGK